MGVPTLSNNLALKSAVTAGQSRTLWLQETGTCIIRGEITPHSAETTRMGLLPVGVVAHLIRALSLQMGFWAQLPVLAETHLS